MAAVEDGLLAVDQGQDKALVDELWNLVNPGVSEYSTGMTLMQQFACVIYVGNKYNKKTTICPLKPNADSNPATASCSPVTRNFSEIGGPDLDIKHMTAAIWLQPFLNIDSNHFILKRLDDVTVAADGKWFILDSCLNVDYDPDQLTTALLAQCGAGIFGSGNQFGWGWTWSEPDAQ